MRIEPLKEEQHADWDRFAAESPDAWFWHTTEWMRFTRAIAGAAFRENRSFWVLEGESRLGIVPAFLEHGPYGLTSIFSRSGEERPRLSYAGIGLPAPALHPALGTKKRWAALAFIVEQLKELAAREGVAQFQLAVPVMAERVLLANLPPANPLVRLGALDLPYMSQVIDLRQGKAELWDGIRHGHQYDIHRAEKTLRVRFWSGPDLSDETFARYQALHAKDAGRVTRASITFDIMKEWARTGKAVLVEVTEGEQSVGFALLLLFGKGAFYGSTCKDPDRADLRSSHAAQWASIQWLKERGFWFYDIGVQQFSRQWFDLSDTGYAGVAKFKRGFGGSTVPMFTGEFHANEEILRTSIQQRLEQCLKARDKSSDSVPI